MSRMKPAIVAVGVVAAFSLLQDGKMVAMNVLNHSFSCLISWQMVVRLTGLHLPCGFVGGGDFQIVLCVFLCSKMYQECQNAKWGQWCLFLPPPLMYQGGMGQREVACW